MAGESSPEVIQVTPPEKAAPSSAQALAAEYELPNSDFDPDKFKPLTTAAPVEPTVAAVEPKAPAKPQHSKRVLRMAQDFGIPQAEIDVTEPEALEEALVLLNRQMLAERKSLIRTPGRAAAETADVSPAESSAAPPPAFDLGLTKEEQDDLHPTIVAALQKIGAAIAAIKGEMATYGQREQRREHESFQQRCDQAFARHETALGKGSYGELDPQGTEIRRRQAVLDTVARDKSRLPFEKKIDSAVAALFGTADANLGVIRVANPEPPATAPLPRDAAGKITGARPTVEEWNAAATVKPTQRREVVKPPGVERAKEFVAEEMKKRDYFAGEGANGAPAVRDEDTIPD